MSCNHRYYPHGCDWPVPPPEWYDGYGYGYRPRRYRDEVVVVRDEDDDFEFETERPRRRRGSSGRRRRRYEYDDTTEEVTAASLQSRAEALRTELLRIEEDLRQLSSAQEEAPEA